MGETEPDTGKLFGAAVLSGTGVAIAFVAFASVRHVLSEKIIQEVSALLSASGSVDRWAPTGPILTPLDDALLFLGVAVAVRVAFRGGRETPRDRTRSHPMD